MSMRVGTESFTSINQHTVGSYFFRAPVTIMQETVAAQTAAAETSQESFLEYIAHQLQHIKWLLGALHAQNVDPNYWLTTTNNGKVTIATDGSVVEQKGYFAVILHTENKKIRFQGPCYCNKALILLYRAELT
eukprot:13145550-Ditylum_brightwellii.AAC.1